MYVPRMSYHGHHNDDPDLTRAPATAKVDAGDDTGRPRPNHLHHSTRMSARVT